MDIVSDSTVTGRSFRVLAIVDDYSQERPAIEVDASLGGTRVVGVLERLAETRGLPEVWRLSSHGRGVSAETWTS